jgi:hypothetical protein
MMSALMPIGRLSATQGKNRLMTQRLYSRIEKLMSAKSTGAIVLLGGLAPAAVIIWVILKFGMNIPFWDEWDATFPVAIAARDGTLTFDQLIAQHNEHRLFFTRVVAAVNSRLFAWNLRAEMLVAFLLVSATFVLLLLLLRRDEPDGWLLMAIPFSLILYSPMQVENWLLGIQTLLFFSVFFLFAMLCVFQLSEPGALPTAGAALLALCATYSYALGLLAWPLGLLAMLLLGYRKPGYYVVWLGLAAVSLGFFFHGYRFFVTASSSPPLAELAHYVLIFLANPFVSPHLGLPVTSAIFCLLPAAGVLLLAANALAIWQRDHNHASRLAAWLTISGIGLGGGIMAAVGRAQLGLSQAQSSRYVPVGSLFWLGVLALAMIASLDILRGGNGVRHWQKLLPPLNLVMGLALAGLYASGYLPAIRKDMPTWQVRQINAQACVFRYPGSGDRSCLETTYLVPAVMPQRIFELEAYGLSDFKNQPVDFNLSGFDLEPVGEPAPARYRTYAIEGTATPVLYQRPPSMIEVAVGHIPKESNLAFNTAIYVDTHDASAVPPTPESGVAFRLYVIADGVTEIVIDQVFDPSVDRLPIPELVSLQPYAGKQIRLRLQTDSRQEALYDGAMWVQPHIISVP